MSGFDGKQSLIRVIRAKDGDYNPGIRMLRSPFSSPGYHTQIKQADYVHTTNQTAIYALGLLDTGLQENERRAFDMLEQLVSLQDTDRDSPTFGIWSWFYEEPLERMAPPDWNWADFIGKQLALVLKRHGQRPPESLRADVQTAVCNSCDAIIKRDVGPHYTNIAIMGAFVTLIAGEQLDRPDYRAYGLERLCKLHRHVADLQAFQEYNSPTYTIIAIVELSKIRESAQNGQARALADELLRMAWTSVGEHYHAATGQWAGPHSRCYGTPLPASAKAFLQVATGGALAFFAWDELPYEAEWYESGISCPEAVVASFKTRETRTLNQLYATDGRWGRRVAYTHMTPEYALGSFKRDTMWNQTRTLLLYADNGGEPTYAHLRCLHDGYDYCSAVFNGAQHEHTLLYGVDFVTDGGDTHPNLDKIDGTIHAADLRLRLEIGGRLDDVRVETDGARAVVRIGSTTLKLDNWLSAFGQDGEPLGAAQWELNRAAQQSRYGTAAIIGLDWVLYAGARRLLDFRLLDSSALVFTLVVGEEAAVPQPAIEQTGDRVRATIAAAPDRTLALDLALHNRR